MTAVSTAASSETDMAVVFGLTAVEKDFALGSSKARGSKEAILLQRTKHEGD